MTASNKLSRIIAVFLCAVLSTGILLFTVPANEAHAASNYWFGTYSSGRDRCTIQIKFWNLKSGSKARIVFDIKKNEFHVRSKTEGVNVTNVDNREGTLTVSITPKNEVEYQIELRGTGLKAGSASIKSCNISNSTTKTAKKTTKKKKATPKKTTVAKKAAPVKKKVVKKKTANTSVTTAAVVETTENTTVTVLAAVDNTSETSSTTTIENEVTPADVNLSHNDMEKNRKSFAWLWIVLLAIAGGLSYLRVRTLKNQGKKGKDLVLDFIPGVGDIVYGLTGSTTKYAPIASDAQHGYSYNPAAGKKEIKQIDEEEKKAAATPFKPQMHKRPKELSVNHAAAVASQNSGATPDAKPAAAAVAAAAGMVSRKDDQKDSPFKPVEGLERPTGVDPNEVFKTVVNRPNEEIMTSAFKPTAGSHTTDKIVSSAFKPTAGSHTTDKIVTSAVKPTSKFQPQKGQAKVAQQDSEAVRQARERAEAAREQQAMRLAMRTGRSVAEIKGEPVEAKPRGPIKRPSAFSSNRAAAAAAGGTGASLGVGASAAADSKSGPVISPAHAKASSNSNQLGNMLTGKNHNAAGRAPVWAAPGTAGINPFKKTEDVQDAIKEDAVVEHTVDMSDETPRTSYADQAKSHKSAFFARTAAKKDPQTDDSEESQNAYGSIVRPTAKVGEDEHVFDRHFKPAMGSVLEGQKPAIMDPGSYVAPTADKPVFGFKPVDPQ